jgi:oligogalacturonide transporter
VIDGFGLWHYLITYGLSELACTFLADLDEVLTGLRREGIYAGAMTFAGKLTG